MGFITRMLLPEKRAKLYFHGYGYERAFGRGEEGLSAGKEYFVQALAQRAHLLTMPTDFVLGCVYGEDDGSKMAEMFFYKSVREWPGNPSIIPWVFKNGIYVLEDSATEGREVACEDMSMAFSDESAFRRITKSPEEFLYGMAPSRFFPDE